MALFRQWLWDGARLELGLVPIEFDDTTFPFVALQEEYSVTERDKVLLIPLEGGLPYTYLDMIGGTNDIAVKFVLEPAEYDEFWTYYNGFLNYGVDSFNMLLSVDGSEPAALACRIVSGTITVPKFKFGLWEVKMTVEALLDPIDDAANQEIIDAFMG